MFVRARTLVAVAVVAFLISALRFLPSPPLSTDLADFVGGVGVGVLIAAVIVWAGQRTPRG